MYILKKKRMFTHVCTHISMHFFLLLGKYTNLELERQLLWHIMTCFVHVLDFLLSQQRKHDCCNQSPSTLGEWRDFLYISRSHHNHHPFSVTVGEFLPSHSGPKQIHSILSQCSHVTAMQHPSPLVFRLEN